MSIYVAELIGTALLVLLGDGVVAGVLLTKSKAQNGGWVVVTLGWGFAVAMAAYAVGRFSGAQINPAVTLGLAVIGSTPWHQVPEYLAGEFSGAIIGAILVYLHYLPHWKETEDPGLKLAVFSTGPAIRNWVTNIIAEIIGTFVLVFGVLAIGDHFSSAGITSPQLQQAFSTGLPPLLVGFLVLAIGLSLGGPTGYAINPARDLGPRIAHFFLPIPGKGSSDWAYAWIPVVGPLIGGVLGAVAWHALVK